MNIINTIGAGLMAGGFLLVPTAMAQHAGHGEGAAALPAVCTVNANQVPEQAAGPAHATEGASAGHLALAKGMEAMHRDMAIGMTADDIDTAFICGMIPHHQGAIDMARAQLEFGSDPWARELAEAIIAAQEREIADMLAWLEARR